MMSRALSAASVKPMVDSTGATGPGPGSSPVTGGAERGWNIVGGASAVLALAGVLSLALVLLLKVAGVAPWAGLNWIAMIGLPLAFLGMGAGLLHAIHRRRSL
jgi:hypothetical protein